MSRLSVFGGKVLTILCVFIMITVLAGALVGCDGSENSAAPNVFNINFVLNNGEKDIEWQTGDDMPHPTRDGYVFDGWFYDREFEKPADVDDLTGSKVDGKVTLYAKWTPLLSFENLIFEDLTCEYDGEAHSLTVQNLPEGATATYSENSFTDAGEYTVNVEVTADNYAPWHGEATLTILKATFDVSKLKFEDETVYYDGFAHNIYVYGDLEEGMYVTYEGNGQTEVGDHVITAHFHVGDNYQPIPDMTATLHIVATEHTVKFVHWDGTEESFVVQDGETLSHIPTPKPREGYNVRWQDVRLDNIRQDITVQEECTPIEYHIYYDFKGGSASDDYPTVYTVESEITLVVPTRDYYSFDGWFATENFEGQPIEKIDKGSTGDKELFAKWTATVFYVYYEVRGGINNMGNITDREEGYLRYTVEDAPKKLLEATRPHYDFGGWFEDEACEQSQVETIDTAHPRTLTLYAKWTPTTYTIDYVLGEGGVNDEANPHDYNIESGVITLLPATRENYSFDCWRLNSEDGAAISQIDPADGNWECADVTLYAAWKAKTYDITYELNGGDNNGGNPAQFTVDDEPFDLKPAIRRGYDFAYWQDEEGNQISRLDTSIARNIRLTAQWSAHIYRITYNYAGNHTNPSGYTIEQCPLTLTPGVHDGYEFVCWQLNGREITVITEDLLGDLVLTALEEKQAEMFAVENGILTAYDDEFGGSVTVPAEYDGQQITGIAAGVFDDSIVELTIEAPLTELAEGVFDGCTSLQRLVLPDSLTALRSGVFAKCGKLRELRLPFAGDRKYESGMTNMVFQPFAYLFSYDELEGYYSVMYQAINVDNTGSVSLHSVNGYYKAYIPSSLETVIIDGDVMPYAFRTDSDAHADPIRLKRVEVYGDSVGQFAFEGCTVEEAVFYNPNVTIEHTAFYNATSLGKMIFYGNKQAVPDWLQSLVNLTGAASVEVRLKQDGAEDLVQTMTPAQ